MFSSRTSWSHQHNRLTEILNSRRLNRLPIYDLTNSNPTQSGISYPVNKILKAISRPGIIKYQPDPHGLLTARLAISKYYQHMGVSLDPKSLFLTAGTSEAYSMIFRLLCNAGECVLVPKPSYPLFDFLAQINDVSLQYYHLSYDNSWRVDIDSIRTAISKTTRAIVLVHPHNPTGMFIKHMEFEEIKKIAYSHQLPLIVDEVFTHYGFNEDVSRITSAALSTDGLTFTLNGISKMIGLPQMKLGWIVVSGEPGFIREASERLEFICDTFLSVNTLAQVALPDLLTLSATIGKEILNLLRSNYSLLDTTVKEGSALSVLKSEGGWYAILRAPRIKDDDEWSIELLERNGIYLYPGYFFEFVEDYYFVVSLLVEPKMFTKAIRLMVDYVSQHC